MSKNLALPGLLDAAGFFVSCAAAPVTPGLARQANRLIFTPGLGATAPARKAARNVAQDVESGAITGCVSSSAGAAARAALLDNEGHDARAGAQTLERGASPPHQFPGAGRAGKAEPLNPRSS